MYHARISIFKIDGARKGEEKKKEKKAKRHGREEGQEEENKDEEETDTRRSDVAERDLERPGNVRLVSRPQLIVQSKRNV